MIGACETAATLDLALHELSTNAAQAWPAVVAAGARFVIAWCNGRGDRTSERPG
jgi:hypothetical protein